MTDTSTHPGLELARALEDAVTAGDEERTAGIEGAVIERLGISLDETEQGLTPGAVARIEEWMTSTLGRPWTYRDENDGGGITAEGLEPAGR